MSLRTSEKVVQGVMNRLDGQMWSSLTDKAISKMPKFKLVNQSEKMFNDFAILTSDGFMDSTKKIKEDNQQLITFKENMIIGTSKLQESTRKTAQSMPRAITHGRDKKRLASAIQLNKKHDNDDKKSHLFRLTMPDAPNVQDQKIDDTLRTAKYDNIRYNQSLQEHEKQRRAMSEHRSLMEKKKFKEMKIFTYDYEGKLISLGGEKNTNSKIHVVNMKPHFGNHINKTFRSSYQKPGKHQKILQIISKRVIGIKTPAIQSVKQTQKQKQQKASKHVKLLQDAPNMLDYFKEDDKVQVGVSITDLNSKSKFIGGNRDKNEIKNAKLTEFRGEFKQLEKFKQKNLFKKLKFREQSEPTVVRTQYIQPSNVYKMKTQATDKDSKVFTTVTGLSRKRGRIDIKNQRLYTQNFIEDLD